MTSSTVIFSLVSLVASVAVGSASAQSTSGVPPTLIPISGQLTTALGDARTGNVLLVLSLYDAQDDPAPRWVEHQVVTLDGSGRYDVQFGSTLEAGLPPELFSGTPGVRWVGVAVENEPEQPRMMLLSVPYAARAATADSLAGRAASDFVLTDNLNEAVTAALETRAASATPDGSASRMDDSPLTSATTPNTLVRYSDSNGNTASSNVFDNNGNVGIGTQTPGSALDVRRDINGAYTPGMFTLPTVTLRNAEPDQNGLTSAIRFAFSNADDTWIGAVRDSNASDLAHLVFVTRTGGSRGERLRITGGGNIGIGTTTPGAPLEVRSNINVAYSPGTFTSPMVTLRNGESDANGLTSAIRFAFSNADDTWIGAVRDSAVADLAHLVFVTRTGGSRGERLRITGAGNLGIGTTTPGSALQINGAAAVGYSASTSAPTNGLAVSGNVGIGTTSPSAKLHVSGGQLLLDNGQAISALNAAGTGRVGIARLESNDKLSIGDGGSVNPSVVFVPNGNFGIGTATPTAKLHVAGAATITGNLTVDGNIAAKYQDVAEWVDSVEALEPGTVVIIDSTGNNRVMAAGRSYDSRVVGAVSAQPGVLLGEPGPGKILVAQSGRVRIKADARYGAIRAGDLLVTSPKKGYAMRSKPVRVGGASMHRPGTVLGKALESLTTGTGEILVLLTLQ